MSGWPYEMPSMTFLPSDGQGISLERTDLVIREFFISNDNIILI